MLRHALEQHQHQFIVDIYVSHSSWNNHFPDIASVYVIDVLVLNVTLRIKFYFVRYTKMAYLILGGEDMGTFGSEGRRCRII